MAKKSRKRLGRYEKDQSGCMWSLIHILNFRQDRSSQKLLQDRKRGSKRIAGATYPDIKLEELSDSCEICKDINDVVQSGTPTVDTSKLSVKELMAEEMCCDLDQKKNGSIANGDAKQTAASNGGHGKNRRRTRSKLSLDLDADGFVAAEDLVAEKPSHRKHKSSSSVDLNIMVEQLCSRIHHKDISCSKRRQDGELAIQSTEDPFVLEEKLGEATKVLVNHFTEGKSFPKDGKIQPSKDLMDALQILDANKEVFLKLLQDPNSQLVKQIKSLRDIQIEEGKFKVLTGSNLERDLCNGKQQSFFWRRFKGLERNLSKKTDTSEDLSRIVVLRPGPPGSKNLDMATTCDLLPESPQNVGDKGHIERASSTFSFSEFKRKLKHAMKKEQHGVVDNGMSHKPSDKQPNLASRDKKVGGETVGLVSPSRDRFFIERIPKASAGLKKVDNKGKLKHGKVDLERDTALSPEQRMSNIYVEAKKHLAEIIGNSDPSGDTPGRQMPKSLGRILSYSGYSSPTICSPRNEGEMRLSVDGECQTDDTTCQVIKENNVSPPGQMKQESEIEPGTAANEPIHEAEVPTLEPSISDGLPCENNVDKLTHGPEIPTSEVDAVIVRSPDTETGKESNLMESSVEPCPLQPICMNEQVDSTSASKCSEENWHSTSSRQDTYNENEPSSSPIASTTCSITEKNEDTDAMSDATSRPSPISVLEPLFKEDDISPPAIKSITAAEPIQPRQIRFEEEISAPLERALSYRTSVGGDKYTFEFVKSVVQMSGLTWDELLRRSLFSDHLIDPSLLDEVDFLPDLLSCDFNLLFDLINEVLIEICRLNFNCMLSFAKKPFVQPELKGKDIFSEIWKGVYWFLKLEGAPHTLEQIVTKDLAKAGTWLDLRPNSENIGIRLQEAILEELMEDTILSCVGGSLEMEFTVLPEAEATESAINVEL